MNELDEAGFFPKDERDIGEPFIPDSGRDALGVTLTKRGNKSGHGSSTTGGVTVEAPPPGPLVQIQLLFEREVNNLKRDVTALGARFGLTIFLGVLVGIIFLDVGKSDPAIPTNINSHFGALIMVGLMAMFGTAQPALLSFPAERPVFLREYSTNHYSVVSYFLSRFTMEALITALQVLVMVRILMNVFD